MHNTVLNSLLIGSSSEPYYCALYNIGEAQYSGNDVNLTLALSGPIDDYRCSYDNGISFESCEYNTLGVDNTLEPRYSKPLNCRHLSIADTLFVTIIKST